MRNILVSSTEISWLTKSLSIFYYILLCEGMETNLFISEYTLQIHNKTKWKSPFDLRIQSQIFLAYYYFIPGNATKMCHHSSCM